MVSGRKCPTYSWNIEDNGKDGSFLDIGTFYIDEPTFDNDRLNLKCIAIPLDGNIRDQKNTKAWEKITLKRAC